MKIFLFLIIFSAIVNPQTATVSGQITGLPFYENIPGAAISIRDAETNELLATAVSDSTGYYIAQFNVSKVDDDEFLPTGYYLSYAYPNPFNPSTNINFSTPVSAIFKIELYNIIGERIFLENKELEPGKYVLNISGLGAAGVYLFAISNNEFKKTEKLLLLDGGSFSPLVRIKEGGTVRLITEKINSIDSLIIRATKEEFTANDTTVLFGFNLIVDIEHNRVTKTGTANYTGDITLDPSGDPGANLNILITNPETLDTLAQAISDLQGEWSSQFPFDFQTNYVDTLFHIASALIAISGEQVQTTTKTVDPFTPNYNWIATVQQITQTTNATYNAHFTNLQTGENVPNAVDSVFNNNNEFLFRVVSDINGNVSKTYEVGFFVQGSDTTWEHSELKSNVSKPGYNPLTFTIPFQQHVNLDKELDRIPYVVDFKLVSWDMVNGQVSDPVIQTIGQDGPRTHTVQGDGKFHVNYQLFYDVVQKDITLIQTTNKYNPYLTIRKINHPSDELNLFENTIADSLPPSYQNTPEDLIVNLDVLNAQNESNIFFESSYYFHQGWGKWVGTMSDTIRSWMEEGAYAGKDGTARYNSSPTNKNDIFLWDFEELSGNPVDPQELAQMEEVLDTLLSLTVHPSGDILMHYNRYTISSLNDPNWLNAIADGLNFIYSRHINIPPGNFVQVNATTGYSENGAAGYPEGPNVFIKGDETWSSLIAVDDNSYGASVGVNFNLDLSINPVGKYLTYKMWMSNPKRRHR